MLFKPKRWRSSRDVSVCCCWWWTSCKDFSGNHGGRKRRKWYEHGCWRRGRRNAWIFLYSYISRLHLTTTQCQHLSSHPIKDFDPIEHRAVFMRSTSSLIYRLKRWRRNPTQKRMKGKVEEWEGASEKLGQPLRHTLQHTSLYTLWFKSPIMPKYRRIWLRTIFPVFRTP